MSTSSSEEVRSLFKEVNGINFHYRATGKGDHVLILIPGVLGSSQSDFRIQLEKVNKDKFHIIAFDPRGYGLSRPPTRDFPVDFYNRDADDAANLMAALGHTSYSVLGWSDGGNSGIILAAKYPDSVRKLVVWGANSYMTSEDREVFQGDMKDISDLVGKMRDHFNECDEEYMTKAWSEWGSSMRRIFDERKGDVCMAECRQVTKPCLILHGDKDVFINTEHPLYIQQNIKGSKLIRLPEGEHHSHINCADQFNKYVEDFLNE